MTVERYTVVKRILWIADCPTCEFRTEKAENAPRETRCPECKTWVPYERTEFESREYTS